MFCPNCGKKCLDSAAFCDGCGTDLKNLSANSEIPVSTEAPDENGAAIPEEFAVPEVAPQQYYEGAKKTKKEFIKGNEKLEKTLKGIAIGMLIVSAISVVLTLIFLLIDYMEIESFIGNLIILAAYSIASVATWKSKSVIALILYVALGVADVALILINLANGGSVGWVDYITIVGVIGAVIAFVNANKDYKKYCVTYDSMNTGADN